MTTFEGSMTALATPFRNGALDEAAYEWLIEYQVTNGTAGLIPMGTTGESVTMSSAERMRAVDVCVKANKGRAKVIAGAGSNSTQDTIDAVKAVRALGCDGAMIVTPYYNKPTQQGLVEHFKLIAKANSGFPLIVYNVPGRTGFDLLPDTVLRLCDVPEVVAIKEATGLSLRALDIFEKCGDRLTILSGDDFTVVPTMAAGAKGVISVSTNVVPRQMSQMVAAARTGDFATARRIQVELAPLHRALFLESNPIPVKMALHLMGHFSKEIRAPLFEMAEDLVPRLKTELQRLKLV